MKKTIFILVSILLFVSNLLVAQTKKELKAQKSQEEYVAIKKIIEGGSYIFVASSANTQSGRRIDLTTNPNSLIIDLDKVISDLPFFGGSTISHYDGEAGIKFDNDNIDFTIEFDDDKLKITNKFDAKSRSESLKLFITISSDGTTTINVTSTHRDFISYRGKTTELKK